MDPVTKHAELVVAGRTDYPNGALHIAACQRHLKELEKQNTDCFSFYFDEKAAQDVLSFANDLTVGEGFEKKPVVTLPHQDFYLGSLFGWKTAKGYRRFRRSYISMARQQGKSFTNGLLGTYISGFSGYQHGKLFTAATKKRQAKIVWDEMAKFILADADLSELYRIQDWRSVITAKATGSTIEALSKEGGLDEGFRSIFASIDELHQMRDNSVYSSLYRGTRALTETLISMITTRGKDFNTFAYDMDKMAVSVLEGIFQADDFFVDIYSADENDKFSSDEGLAKANPFSVTRPVLWENLLADRESALFMGGSELREFVTKSLNRWYEDSENSYIDRKAWSENATDLNLEAMRGRECFIGLDLSSGGDLTSLGFDFDLGNGESFIESHSFMPRGRLMEHVKEDLAPYDVWLSKELLTVTGGEDSFITDYLYIIDYLKTVISEYELKVLGIGYDRHNISSLLPYLDDFGVPLMEVNQAARHLNDATQAIRLEVRSGKLKHNRRNELLTWSFANAATEENSFGEIKVSKKGKTRGRRIDPVDAVIDARAMRLTQMPTVDLNERIMSDDWSL